MKLFRFLILLFATIAIIAVTRSPLAAQKPGLTAAVPRYDPAAESKFKGIVEEVRDRQCPVSGGMGSHLLLKVAGSNPIQVHLAATKFMKTYDLLFKKGDVIEVLGAKVQFEGVDTIFAREITRDGSTFVFRDKTGAPVW